MAPKRVNATVEEKSKKTKPVEEEKTEAVKKEVTLFYILY